MTIEQLKETLIHEHKRDVRLTIIAYALILLLIIIAGILIYLYAWDIFINQVQGVKDFWEDDNNQIYRYILPLVVITLIGYFVFNIMKLARRIKKIDKFIEKIDSRKIAANINTRLVHKIIIPLWKIKLNLCPVTLVLVNFDGELKTFELPIPKEDLPDLKMLLSGVGTEGSANIDKAWYELYDGETTETTENQPLKSVAEFEQYVDTDLKSDIEEVENSRKKGSKKFLIFLIPTILIVVGWMVFSFGMVGTNFTLDFNTLLIAMGIIFGVYYFIMYIYTQKNKNIPLQGGVDTSFKNKIFKKIVHFINPDFKYIMHGHIGLPEFLEMGFFEEKHYDLDGNDQIIGKHNGVAFQLCDLNVTRTRNFSKENEQPDVVLWGQVFITKFNKSFENDVYIVPKKIDDGTSSHMIYNLGEKVTLEDPEFMKMFNVYSTNQVEARYILSTSMMQRIKDMAQRNGKKLLISFRNNRISIANNSGKNNFEISMFKSITKNNKVIEFYQDLCNQLNMIDDLKLNINIWKS